jgi:hypothetical protein
MKKLYEIEDYLHKRVCCSKYKDIEYIEMDDEGTWVGKSGGTVSSMVAYFFDEAVWYEYKEPKKKTKVEYCVQGIVSKRIEAFTQTYEEALEEIEKITVKGSYEIRKVYVRE